jgi:hypothetical protein
MVQYSLRRTPLSDDPNDFVFRCGGADVGRCYLRTLADNEQRWHWTIYIGRAVKEVIEGVPVSGNAERYVAELPYLQ